MYVCIIIVIIIIVILSIIIITIIIIIIIIIIEANLMLHGLKKACRGISPDILRSGK